MKKCLPLLLLIAPLFSEEESEIAYLEPTLLPEEFVAPQELNFTLPEPRKNSAVAVGLSVIPGLGHAYLGDWRTAGGLAGSASAMVSTVSFDVGSDSFQNLNMLTLQNTWCYGFYAALRDTRAYNHFQGYSYKMPTDSLSELALAPFQWSVIKKPEVWGGVLGALVVASGLVYFTAAKNSKSSISLASELSPLGAFAVGIGEETFFRGFLQTTFSEAFTPWVGIVLSSALFGAAHISNTVFMDSESRKFYYKTMIPFISAFGGYFGWLTYKNKSLKESVAVHSWYDFILFSVAYSATQSASVGKPRVGFSLSF